MQFIGIYLNKLQNIWINLNKSEKSLNKSGKIWIYPDKFEKFQITRSLDISLWLQIRVQVHESQWDIFGFLWILLDYFEFYDIGIQGIINVRLNVPIWIQRLVHNFAFFQICSDISRSFQIYSDIFRYFRIFCDLSTYFEIYWNTSRFIWIYLLVLTQN